MIENILAITDSGDYLEDFNNHEKVKVYENQIDQLIYTLYDLTPEEIEIVENVSNKSKVKHL